MRGPAILEDLCTTLWLGPLSCVPSEQHATESGSTGRCPCDLPLGKYLAPITVQTMTVGAMTVLAKALQSLKLLAMMLLSMTVLSALAGAPVYGQSDAGFGSTSSSTGRLFEQVSESLAAKAEPAGPSVENFLLSGPDKWTSREGLSSSLQILILLTVLSLAPAILLMTTCYVRIIVVMGLLRQALGTGQLPPSQVITSISLFMTLFIMAPVWTRVYDEAIAPYTAADSTMSIEQAWNLGIQPVRDFMSRQIDWADNEDDIYLFYSYYQPNSPLPAGYEEVPLQVLLPAYMLSELKTAFLIGFQIFLPFLLIDLVVASVTISMGMMMLPPAMISLPFKLLLFVLIDGWHLIVGMLLESFGTYG